MSVFFDDDNQEQQKSLHDKKNIIPPSVHIHAPYYSQAPDGNRTLPWTMLCSEANLALAAYAIK